MLKRLHTDLVKHFSASYTSLSRFMYYMHYICVCFVLYCTLVPALAHSIRKIQN